MNLNDNQKNEFWENGFITINKVFSESFVDKLCSALESSSVLNEINNIHIKDGGHSLELTIINPIFLQLAKDNNILNLIKPLIGPNIQLQHSKSATKTPKKGEGAFAWHQDFAFFPHTNTDLVAVMVMLDDATPENGCMQMVKGSYKLGLLNHSEEGLFNGRCQEKKLWEDKNNVVNITPKRGGISIHHCLTLHGSPDNISGKPRRGLVFQYRADDAMQLADGIWADTGLLMCGERTETVRCESGVYQLPKSKRYPGHPFGHAWNQEGILAQKRDYYN